MNRRDFMQRSALAAAFLGITPGQTRRCFGDEAPPVPSRDLYRSDPDRYWAELRRQWLLAADRINLNCGSVGCTPLPVLRAMIEHLLAAEAYREPAYPWFGYEENSLIRTLRDSLADFLHCKRDELALVRNATEANNTVCNGLDLKPGDEVLLTDQEHSGGRCCWEQKAARFGIRLKFVQLPKPPALVQEIVDLFARAISPQTRLIAFSHITTVTGLILPAKEICALARKQGILSHVDGAHAIGQIPLHLHDLGCDFYASSPHKWLMAPKGTGTLYIREPLLDTLWVQTAAADWHNYNQKAYRFSNLGTSNLSVMAGLKAALDFFQSIGPERIYTRIHELAKQVRDGIQNRKGLQLANASADGFFGGLVSFERVNGDLQKVLRECEARKIRVAGSPERIRVATHIFTQPTELNALFDAVENGLRS